MGMILTTNLEYTGTSPNFDRDIVETIADMAALSTRKLPPMFLVSCKEDGNLYLYNKDNEVDPVTGKWRKVGSGGSGAEAILTNKLVANQSVGGVTSGTEFAEGTTLEEVLTSILVKEIAPTMSIVLTPAAGTKENGDSFNLTNVKCTVVLNSASAITEINVYNGSDLVATAECEAGTLVYNIETDVEISSTTTIKAVLSYKNSSGADKTLEATGKYTFTDASYVGVLSTESDITEANIKALTKKLVGSKGYTNKYTTENQIMVYAYPKSFGELTSIKDTATGYTLTWGSKEITVNGLTYIVRYSSPGKVTNYNVQFS